MDNETGGGLTIFDPIHREMAEEILKHKKLLIKAEESQQKLDERQGIFDYIMKTQQMADMIGQVIPLMQEMMPLFQAHGIPTEETVTQYEPTSLPQQIMQTVRKPVPAGELGPQTKKERLASNIQVLRPVEVDEITEKLTRAGSPLVKENWFKLLGKPNGINTREDMEAYFTKHKDKLKTGKESQKLLSMLPKAGETERVLEGYTKEDITQPLTFRPQRPEGKGLDLTEQELTRLKGQFKTVSKDVIRDYSRHFESFEKFAAEVRDIHDDATRFAQDHSTDATTLKVTAQILKDATMMAKAKYPEATVFEHRWDKDDYNLMRSLHLESEIMRRAKMLTITGDYIPAKEQKILDSLSLYHNMPFQKLYDARSNPNRQLAILKEHGLETKRNKRNIGTSSDPNWVTSKRQIEVNHMVNRLYNTWLEIKGMVE